jgi:hypothetical protein
VARLGHSGCYLGGKEISATLGRDRGLVYGNVQTGDGSGLKLDALDVDVNDTFIFRGVQEDREKPGRVNLCLEKTRQRTDTSVKAKRSDCTCRFNVFQHIAQAEKVMQGRFGARFTGALRCV